MPSSTYNDRIAIVGLGGLFPGARTLADFWENVSQAADTSREVPPSRWTIPPERAYHPQLGTPDHVCSLRGYFLDPFEADLTGLDIDANLVEELDVLFHLALHAGGQAFRDAQMDSVDRQRVGVILGSIALPTDRVSELAREIIGGGPVSTHPLNRHVTGLPAILLAKALNLGGAAFTLDAACASSLYAIKLAVDELRAGRADAMLAGGLSRPDCLYTQMGFSQLRALSPSGRCSPFDAAADGLVVGEGTGIFVLKRLNDALRHGDTIHGVIAGIGLSNDIEGNLLAPASEGQLRAMRAAYRQAAWQPEDVDLIECHATGTPIGDAVEFQSLSELWRDSRSPRNGCVIGSVKSTVGHLLTGANAAGLHKVLLAMRHGTLPPSANFTKPALGLDLARSPFQILERAAPWTRREPNTPRRAAISGFGFGGINAHMLIEDWSARTHSPSPFRGGVGEGFEAPIAIVSAAAHVGDCDSLASFAERVLYEQEERALSENLNIDTLEIPAGTFPIPPKEMEEMLPQQLLMLQVAKEALGNINDNQRTGVFIGVDLDLNTTNFYLRWWMGEQTLNADPAARLEAMDAASPPLTANRTLGALASIAASRIARAFRCGGPSFTVSSAETSGLNALQIAADLLRNGEIDHALVGAIGLADLRSDRLRSNRATSSGDGAVALTLKRLDDAKRNGDDVLAILGNRHAANSTDQKSLEPVARRVGYCGAADGLAAVARACVALNQRVLPKWAKSQYWLHDSAVGPRAAKVVVESLLGFSHTVALIESSPTTKSHSFKTDPLSALRGRLKSGPRESVSREKGRIAFVYPGSGNHFTDMGRELGLLFPQILDRQQSENRRLRSQYAADEFWNGSPVDNVHPRTNLFAQVSLGTLITDLLRSFGVEPDAVIGYSLGESASLFGMRVWRDRDEMLERLQRSTLFASDLAPPYNSARAQWGWPPVRQIDWMTGVLAAPAAVVEAAIRAGEKAYVLIINTPDECVVGGHRPDVAALIERVDAPFWEVRGVTTAHCDAALPVSAAYRALHHLPVIAPENVRFYSGAWGRDYDVTSDSAADAILAAVLGPIDFPRVVEAAYRDGVRTFIEIGPGASCTRMIGRILKDRPHHVFPMHVRHQNALETLANTLVELQSLGVNLDLTPLHRKMGPSRQVPAAKMIRLPVRSHVPRLEMPVEVEPTPQSIVDMPAISFPDIAQIFTSHGEAHEAFLRFSTNTQNRMAETIAFQTQLLEHGAHVPVSTQSFDVPRSLTFEQCAEFAAGLIGNVLGLQFTEIDSFPRRVRLPDGPLMLVDRIVEIEGVPKSMTSGRVVTEHQVHAERWYLDAGRIPTCVAVEAGQADLFLSGFLGIDFVARGEAVYRLLDAAITFHRGLPTVGDLIRYDIRINEFFRQGDTHLFRFSFESTVNGEPLLSMTDGCAGFFTDEQLASGKGIVQTELDRRAMSGKRPADWQPLVPMTCETYSSEQIEALRLGNLVEAFGDLFAGLPLEAPLRLPGFLEEPGALRRLAPALRLIDRVVHLDPEGGRFGLGIIRAEADIQPDHWFLTCHFVDDMVMPGTLMYECCLHTLRVFLMRMGWIGEEGSVVCEPLPGVAGRLKCRGQVIASTRIASYEVVIKELGFGPEPYAIADALMYADGRPIVEMTNMSLRFSGLDRQTLEKIWRKASAPLFAERKATFSTDRILAFAVGKPSEAFGEPYRIFDNDRVIARLPGAAVSVSRSHHPH